MSHFNTPELESKYYGLFRREPHQEPRLTGSVAIGKTILTIFWVVIGAAIASIIPSRHPPHKPIGLGWAAGFALLVGGHHLYRSVWRPWLNGPAGYRLVGEFEVREKDNLFSKCWVRLLPGDNFLVQVPTELYERLRVGSRLRLTYTAEGEQVSVVLLP